MQWNNSEFFQKNLIPISPAIFSKEIKMVGMTERPSILLLDNDPAILDMLQNYLAAVDADVATAHSANEALELVRGKEFALMIVDVKMPKISGFEFIEQVRKTKAGTHTPVIFISASGDDPEVLCRGYQFGGVDFLAKPVKPEVLRSKAKVFVDLFVRKKEADFAVNELNRVNQSLNETKNALEKSLTIAKSNEEYFRSIFECTSDAVLLLESDYRVVNANMTAVSLLGYSVAELQAMRLSDLFPYEHKRIETHVPETPSTWLVNLGCLSKNGNLLATDVAISFLPAAGRKQKLVVVQDRTERDRLREQTQFLNHELRSQSGFDFIIGKSAGIKEILEKVKLVGPTDATVLISGESGSGKELVARAIHESSSRQKGSFVRVNCGSIPSELFESEFFGHVKGAFTGAVKERIGRFELAHGGTLFLDEVGEIPISCQAKLLRVLQDQEFERVGDSKTRRSNARIIAATNRDLKLEVDEKAFRKDLYYRLSTFPIEVPPLRSRVDDIPILAQHFSRLAGEKMGKKKLELSPLQIKQLSEYSWPGNVRELQQVIDRAVILGDGSAVIESLGLGVEEEKAHTQKRFEKHDKSKGIPISKDVDLEHVATFDDLKEIERKMILDALDRSSWKVYGDDGAAKLLGIKPTTLNSKLQRLGIKKTYG